MENLQLAYNEQMKQRNRKYDYNRSTLSASQWNGLVLRWCGFHTQLGTPVGCYNF